MKGAVIDFEEKRMEKSPPKELSFHLMRLPAKKRLDMILQREDAEAVVAALAEQDFYVSVKEIGPEDSLALLGMARVEQLNHLFDLEWWEKDQVQAVRAVDWLDRLARANENKLLEWLYQADFSLLVALFKQWLKVVLAPEDVDLTEAADQLPANTLDDQYFWETLYPQYEDFLKQFLGVIFEVNYGFYKELMNHIIYAVDVEVGEDAYRFHRGRLEDLAIPDFYDALAIYRSMTPERIVSGKRMVDSDDSAPAPSFALAVVPESDLLGRALATIEDPRVISSLQLELASLANKIVVADQLAPDNPEALKLAVGKAAAYVNLGLQLMGGDSVERASRNLHDLFLEHLFRLAHGRIVKPRNRMRLLHREGWISRWPEKLNSLDLEWMESAELLLRKTPRLLRSFVPGTGSREDFFRTTDDLQRSEYLVDVIESVGRIFDVLAPNPEYVQMVLWPEGQIRDLADVTIGSMIWTAAARFRLEDKWVVEPIPTASWVDLFPLVTTENIQKVILTWLNQSTDARTAGHLAAYLAPLFRLYEEETAPFGAANPPDPGLVRFFMFKE